MNAQHTVLELGYASSTEIKCSAFQRTLQERYAVRSQSLWCDRHCKPCSRYSAFFKLLFHFKVYRERPGGRQKAVALEKVLCLASF